MVRYSDELIDEIKSSNDIVDTISQYVTLKRSGRNFFGLCPFHKEKSPSFSVSPDKQIFHCFGCGVGGNVIHFISKIENLDFRESLEFLAERSGIELPTSEKVQLLTLVSNQREELYEKALIRKKKHADMIDRGSRRKGETAVKIVGAVATGGVSLLPDAVKAIKGTVDKKSLADKAEAFEVGDVEEDDE